MQVPNFPLPKMIQLIATLFIYDWGVVWWSFGAANKSWSLAWKGIGREFNGIPYMCASATASAWNRKGPEHPGLLRYGEKCAGGDAASVGDNQCSFLGVMGGG